jgi:hypothetical protein
MSRLAAERVSEDARSARWKIRVRSGSNKGERRGAGARRRWFIKAAVSGRKSSQIALTVM